MNLADAIRRAANGAPLPNPANDTLDAAETRPAEGPALEVHSVTEPVPPAVDRAPGLSPGFVRLELFLHPDQITSLLKSVLATQTAVMTLREAAHFLRMSSSTVESLAERRELPGFQLDGRWRFSRNALEEWVAAKETAA